MKQRFGIAQALLANPKLVVVDEPTAGLDPAERNRFYDLLSSLGEQTIIILSTHIVEDVKELCTRMAIINQGKVLLEGNPSEAIENLQDKVYSKIIKREERDQYKEEYNVISDRLLLGQPIIHVISEKNPGDGFKPVISDLSDVYFSLLFGQSN